MAKQNPNQFDLFNDWLVVEQPVDTTVTIKSEDIVPLSFDESRHVLALRLAQKLDADGEITSKFLTDEANRAFGGTQAEGTYSSKDAYDALEAAFNIHLLGTEDASWTESNADLAISKAVELTVRIQNLPTQTRRDEEMDEFQQFSTPPALSFVANWVANITREDEVVEPSAGTGDLAIWSRIAGAKVVLNELSPRRQALLSALFPNAQLFKENAEQLDNVLPTSIKPTTIIMNPPFSSSAGRVQGQRDTTNGARHLEQALKRLEEGGRLVAIVGNGMAADRPAFTGWWSEIQKKYNVRANIGISGKEYAKYGTTFDNQILVIDKTGATTQPVLTGNVESVADLPTLLEGIRNDRQRTQSNRIKPAGGENTQPVPDTLQPGHGTSSVGLGADSTRAESIGDWADSGAATTDSQTGGTTTISDGANDGIGAGNGIRNGSIGDVGGSSGADIGGNPRIPESNSPGNFVVEAISGEVSEFTDSVFANYTPQRLSIPGAQQHPGKLVQSAAMSAVEPPAPTYSPVLPENVIRDGLLSIAQLESVVYAGQAHSELLLNGSRKGFFIGDGTGVGKGREISGIILDNMMQGRTKAVWVSFNEGLIEDARRDFVGVGGDPSKIFFQGKTKAGNEITQKDGILFTTYSTLRGGEKKQANDLGQKSGKTRTQQIIEWLGTDFAGIIAFDEAHSMGNAIQIKGARGVRKPSQQAIAGINLQRELPNARVTYVSATGATEVSNLSYADRLGLWGEGTPFADTTAFINGVSKGGIASMELISRDMKAMGMYLARSLSFDGVTYERMEHTLSDLQEDIYNELAGAWQVVLNNVEKALEMTQAGKSGAGKSAAMSQFWGAHQRFFNQIITAMQTPAVIDHIREQLAAGHVAVIQLVNTNEAAQERIIAEATANDAPLEELDFTPRQMLSDYVKNGFPVAAYEETTDANGNTVYVPVRDSEGNLVFDREAIALRDALLETLQQIRVPENPLDSIINAFGSDRVAEVTGRGRRFVQTRDDDGNLKVVEEKRGKNSSRADAEAFQANKKDILIFSGAGGTGYSFHADNTAENKRKRIHYILQPGWRADGAVQGFGRSHRTNQAQEPHYVLPTTNLKAQKRFVSSIARRLDQLGALTRGQREATSQGMFTASDNLESQYASTALNNFFRDLYRGTTNLSFHDVTKQMGLNLLDENASLNESNLPGIPQFLNRLLSLTTDMQNAVFGEFENRLIEAVEYAKQRGLYDLGLQTMTALSIEKTRDDVAYEDKKTGAKTRYVELAVTNEVRYNQWDDVKHFGREQHHPNDISGWFVSEFGKNKGEVFFLKDIGTRLDSDGKSVHRGVVHTIRKNEHRYIDNADDISRGYDYRTVNVNGVGTYQKVTLTRAIDEFEAERLWNEQVANAPKTETKTERMLVGVILPIWDRVEGSEFIQRLQTDDGEQLLGRMVGAKSAKQTLKNLGLDSGLSNMSVGDLFGAIKKGSKAILSNGWEIVTAKVNYEDRIEIKGRSYFTEAEKRVLKEQGAFVERINWNDRVFISTGDSGPGVFERITASKPVVDLIEKSRSKDVNKSEADQDQDYGIPQSATPDENALPVPSVGELEPKNVSSEHDELNINGDGRQEVSTVDKKPFHEKVAESLIKQLEEGTAPWQRPWEAGASGSFVPFNPVSGVRYKGINALYLMSQDRDDQRWMTFKQSAQLGGQVRKGEHGTPIQYWKFTEERTRKDGDGKPVLDGDGNPIKDVFKLERPRVFHATVFNAAQIDGLPPLERKEQTWDGIERAENILAASGAAIRHNGGGRAFYRPSTDSIHLPDKGQFPTADSYYSTALHELGHWTGHEDRLNRDLAHPFGSEAYAKEELRAEIASMILGDELGIGHDPSQHAAYVGSWIKALKDDPLEIFRAAADAEKIQKFVLGLEQQQIQERTKQEEQTLTVADMTAEQYQALAAADEIYQRELIRVYGDDKASDARYQLTHDDAEVQNAADAFRAASEMWHNAVAAAREKLASNNSVQRNSTEMEAGLPRVDSSTLGPVGGDIAATRLLSDQAGVTIDIERLAFTCLTASQIVQTLEDRLAPVMSQVMYSGLVPFVRQVQASLGIPSLTDANAFQSWQEAVSTRLTSPESDIPLIPRADVSALGEVGESIDRARDLADQLGLTADIERMAYDGFPAAQIAKRIESSLDADMRLALSEQFEPATAALYFVRQVKASLGVPPIDDVNAYHAWRDVVADRMNGMQAQQQAQADIQESPPLESDIAARKAIESTNNDLLVIPKNEMNVADALGLVLDDIDEFIKIENKEERRLAAIAIGHSAEQQVAYHSELQRQNPDILKEAETAYLESLRSNASGLAVDIALVLQRPEEWTFDHYQDYEGASLDEALRNEGLNSIEDVTGNVPGRLFDTAIERLSPIFGIEPSDNNMSNAYLERKALAQAFQTIAERLIEDQSRILSEGEPTQDKAESHGISSTIPSEGIELDRRYVLDMFPELNGPHGKPNGFGIYKITLMPDGKVAIDSDSKEPLVADIASKSETGVTHQDIADYYERGLLKTVVIPELVEQTARTQIEGGAMGVTQANNSDALVGLVVGGIEQARAGISQWNSPVGRSMGTAEADAAIEFVTNGEYDKALDSLQQAATLEATYSRGNDFRNVATTLESGWRDWQASNGVGPSITPEMKRSFDAIPADLTQLSSATVDDYLKAAEAARLEEDAVKNNPNSTNEDIAAARERRKTADLAVTVNDSAFQNKVSELEQQAQASNQSGDSKAESQKVGGDKAYINVPYREKSAAKELGAQWDRQQTSWYIPAGVDPAPFAKWLHQAGEVKTGPTVKPATSNASTSEKQYLAVPYTERGEAKAAGAKWDAGAKSWYAGPSADMSTLQRWLPGNVKNQQDPSMSPRDEFSEALRELGCIVDGKHPVMDGTRQRIPAEGDRNGEKSGFYVAHLDGHPAGFIQNNRTGDSLKWKSKGYALSEEEKAALHADSAIKLQQREMAQAAQHKAVALAVRELLAVAPPAPADHQYLQSKQARPGGLRMVPEDGAALSVDSAVMIGKNWKESKELRDEHPDKLVFTAGDLLLAAQDVCGEIQSVQSIQGTGLKRFAAGGAKQDMFHVVGGNGLEALVSAPAIVIGEGYATADTVSQLLGYATVSAFDSGNLPNVAKLLHDQFPNKPFVIAGDNDLHRELLEGRNPGKEKAEIAAKAVGGTAIFPIFAPGEQTYPTTLEPVTPALARSGGLSEEQKHAIEKMKGYCDFNDLATKSVLGRDGVERQLTNIVNKLVEDHQERIAMQQQQDKVEKLEHQQQQRQAPRKAATMS